MKMPRTRTRIKRTKKKKISIFVARPFRDNVSTCHSWSLKPYFEEQFKKYYKKRDKDQGIEEYSYDVEINDAADMTRLGAITCEKICRPIQKSNCVIADVSLPNPNVMYELGLALGLGKDIILVANENQLQRHKTYTNNLLTYIDPNKSVLRYPGVGFPTEDIALGEQTYIIAKTIEDSSVGLNFVSLSIIEDQIIGVGENPSNEDIILPFHNIVEGSIGFAIQDAAEKDKTVGDILKEKNLIKKNKDSNPNASNPYHKCLVELEPCENRVQNTTHTIKLNDAALTFESISKAVDNAFCCIIDLAGESPLSYLWLGYCHARGINAIPIFRKVNPDAFNNESELIIPSATSSMGETPEGRVLAFDIRALWYIDYENIEPNILASLLSDGFSELIRRDLPRLERDRFWNRLAHSGKIHIFTGAIHINNLQREMVGDWDQRTVSELVRYLASTDSTVIPELKPPVYGPYNNENTVSPPDTVKKSLKREISREKIASYHDEVEELLKEKDCIIVASADVNALTEILLAHAYLTDLNKEDFIKKIFPCEHGENEIDNLNTVIALKNVSDENNPRQFSRGAKEDENLEPYNRGFRIDSSETVQQSYRSQEQSKDGGEFSLLSHFLLMQNPFPASENNFIVILNGVSGPGTCALAEILTGGNTHEKNLQSEKMLKLINEEFANINEGQNRCVQGIVKVTIDSKPAIPIYDQREVIEWNWCEASTERRGDDIVRKDRNPWSFGEYSVP